MLYIYNCMQIYITGCIFLQSKKTGMMQCSYPLFDCRYPHWYPLIPFITFHEPLICILLVPHLLPRFRRIEDLVYLGYISRSTHMQTLCYIYTCWLCSYTYTHVHVCIYTNTLKKKYQNDSTCLDIIYIYNILTYRHDMTWHGMALPYFTLHYIALHM